MKILKLAFGLVCLLILAGNMRTLSRWTEARGVYDDVCYLRQAHLFSFMGSAASIRTSPETGITSWRAS